MPSATLAQETNIAQLRRSGLVLYPREVVAIVHALSISYPATNWAAPRSRDH